MNKLVYIFAFMVFQTTIGLPHRTDMEVCQRVALF